MHVIQLSEPADDWFVFQAKVCHGPFTRTQVARLIVAKRVDREALLRRGDWLAWRRLSDCLHELAGDDASSKAREPRSGERRIAAPRAAINGTIHLVNEKGAVLGGSYDISVSGIFVTTPSARFEIGDQVALIANARELPRPIQAKAAVRRFNLDPRHPIGYGLSFVTIDNRAIVDITRLVGVRSIAEFGDVASPRLKSSAEPLPNLG